MVENKKIKTLSIGSTVADFTFETSGGELSQNAKDLTRQKIVNIELGAKLDSEVAEMTFGGGAANTAVNFSALGCEASILTGLGKDSVGEVLLKNLEKRKVKKDFLIFSAKNSAMSAIIVFSNFGNEHTLFSYDGATKDIKIESHKIAKKKFNLVYLSSLPEKGQKKNLDEFVKTKQLSSKMLLGWNPGKNQLKMGFEYLKKYIKNADYLVLNKDEAIELSLTMVDKEENEKKYNDVKFLLKKIGQEINGCLVITNGSEGAYAFKDNKIYSQKAYKVKVKDTTGAGDAFGSTFCWALTMSGDIQKALRLAAKNSASVLSQRGAQAGFLTKNKFFK